MSFKAWLKLQPKLFIILLVVLCVFREWKKGYFKHLMDFFRHHEWKTAFQILMAFGILVTMLLPLDLPMLRWVQSFQHPLFRDLSTLGGFFGKSIHPWLILLCGYTITFVLSQPSWNRTLFRTTFSAALASGMCHLLKFVFLRARPFVGEGPFSFWNVAGFLKDDGNYMSFASGDVAVVAGACCYLFYIVKNRALAFALMLLPMLTAIDRMMLNKHWPSDVTFAIGLGFIAGWIVFSYDDYLHSKKIAL